MTAKSNSKIQIDKNELREVVTEVIREEFTRFFYCEDTDYQHDFYDEEYSKPDEFSVHPSSWYGKAWKYTKRAGEAAVGLATAPVTALYSGITRNPSAIGWSAHRTADGIGGNGTWNSMRNTYHSARNFTNNMCRFQRVMVSPYMCVYRCGNCGQNLTQPVTVDIQLRPFRCPNCGAVNVGV